MNTPPSKISIIQYSILALPLAFAGLPLYVHAPDFYTRELGLSLGLIGVILLVIRLFDAIQDPLIGHFSDKHASRRFAIVSAGATMLVAGMAAVFYGPQFAVPTATWFALSMVLATTGFSIVTINLNMIGGFWHDAPQQRTRISAWREAFALIGLLVASVLPAALQNYKPVDEAFQVLFWTFAVIMIAGFIMFTRFMKRISPEHKITKPNITGRLSFLPILIGPDRHFFGVCFLTHLAAALPGVMVIFFIRDYLGAENLTGLFLFLYFVAGAALMIIWVKVANKIGKERAWLVSMLLAIATFIWAYFLQPGDVIAYGIICVLSGMALGADLALPPAILADRVTRQKTESEATQYYALIAFIPKMAIAIASGAAFLLLDRIGFVVGGENSDEVMHGLIILYALVPCIIKLVAAIYLWRLNTREGYIHEHTERIGSHGTINIS
jgi:GPH family glycoside/pentoside/hexuronide:cation symporter